jgi:hypothetical protein
MTDGGASPRARRFAPAVIGEMILCLFLIGIFAMMFGQSYEWEIEAGLFPRMISGLGMLSVLAYLGQIVWRCLAGGRDSGRRILDIPWARVDGDARAIKKTALGVIAWALVFWAGIWMLGFHVAAPAYLYSQLVIYGEVKKWIAGLAAGVCLVVIVVVYDRLAETTWNDPVLFDLVQGIF